MGLKLNDNGLTPEGLNPGTVITFEDGREIKLYTNEEITELINGLNYILENGNLL